jgi:hypothetical protein
MIDSYDLTKLNPDAFEQLVNTLALKVLGAGATGFGPGSDGGRDGYFEGTAPYPSEKECWSGRWYIQSKFHKPHLSANAQKWLLEQIKNEIQEFTKSGSKRKWPDVWILATNIDPSGTPKTGTFDRARDLVAKAHPALETRFHIWGGSKISSFLEAHPSISDHYADFISPWKQLIGICRHIKDSRNEPKVKRIFRFLILDQLDEQRYAKLEQAGSASDSRQGIHDLFIDLPFLSREFNIEGLVLKYLIKTASRCHRINEKQEKEEWGNGFNDPSRAKVWFIKGGPGHGKSTISQFFSQIQRAALIVDKEIWGTEPNKKVLANQIKTAVQKRFDIDKLDLWPSVPRIPISLELKEFAQWFGEQNQTQPQPRRILTYLAQMISAVLGERETVTAELLTEILGAGRWLVIFDGLDEVPQDFKEDIAKEVCYFVNNDTTDADILTICTSRPQGYSGQFDNLDSCTIELTPLSPEQALDCAKPVLEFERNSKDAKKSIEDLRAAIKSPAVAELMTTPLQSHIMAVVVRDGQRPPERKWKLFSNFYQVIKRREANRATDSKLKKLLQEQGELLKTVHNRLGFILHAQAESSQGAKTKLHKDEFKKLVTDTVAQMMEIDIDETIQVLMKATTDRLVLVNTPDDGDYVRFDIRQLQEFFAAEFLYESVTAKELSTRLELIAGDAHWREVVHFLLSALIENDRQIELTVAVEVLENLNEGDEDDLRLLKRGLGKGAILAAKLLEEGVLEQGKSIRQKFRNCLKPLAASTNLELLKVLVKVNLPNSKTWLLNFLISCLDEERASENIGAIIVLSQILPDDNGSTEKVAQIIRSSPIEYISALLTILAKSNRSHVLIANLINRNFNRYSIKKWFLKLVIEIILTPQWMSLTQEAFNSALDIIRFHENDSYDVVKKMFPSFSSPIQTKLFQILREPKSQLFIVGKQNESFIVDIVEKQNESLNLIFRKANLTEIYLDQELLNNLDNIPIIFQIIYLLISLNQNPNPSDLIKILEKFQSQKSNSLKYLISYLKDFEYFYEDILLDEEIGCLKNMNQQDFENIYWQNKDHFKLFAFFPDIERYLSLNTRENTNILGSFQSFIDNYPMLAIFLVAKRAIQLKENQQEIFEIVANKIIEIPKIAPNFPSIWKMLIKNCPEKESELRQVFLSASCENIDDNENIYKYENSVERLSTSRLYPFNISSIDISSFRIPFKINLPSEASLLPHLLNQLTNQFFFISRISLSPELKDIFITPIAQAVEQASGLEQIYNNLSFCKNIRAAATIMLLLHPNGDKQIEDLKKLLVELYDSEVGCWYIKSVIFCLCVLAAEEQPVAQWIINGLLEKAREDYQSKQYFQYLLNLWRENSFAPVRTASIPKDTIPTENWSLDYDKIKQSSFWVS